MSVRTEAFQQGLRELGYVEGKNIVIDYRYAEGKLDRLNRLVAELVRLKVDVIVSGGPAVTRSIKEATSTIPAVMTFDDDPLGSGFVATLAQPGGNITGLSTLAPEISGKQMELLNEVVPKLSRAAVFGNATMSGNAQALGEVKAAAEALGIRLRYLEVQAPKDIEPAFRAATEGHVGGILVLPIPFFLTYRRQFADLAVKSRLPVIHWNSEYVEGGGLMTYGASIPDSYRRAATYVDKILKGAKPGDPPVEQPTKFEFVINLKAAKQIGVAIPQSVLYRADRVIK